MTPENLEFIKAHLGIDMTALEIARHFGVNPAEIHVAADKMELGEGRYHRPTAVHSPSPFRVAKNVRKATLLDAYEPLSMDEFRTLRGGLIHEAA